MKAKEVIKEMHELTRKHDIEAIDCLLEKASRECNHIEMKKVADECMRLSELLYASLDVGDVSLN